MKRLQHIDIAKGLGMLLVVWGHSFIEFGHYIIYMFHMPLFFYLSGLFHKSCGYKELLMKKFRALILPLIIFIFILFPISFLDDHSVLSFKPPHLNGIFGPLWFLISLFFLSIIYHPMLKIRPYPRLCLCVSISFLLGFLPSVFDLQNYIYAFTTFSALVFYAMGNVIGDKFVKLTDKKYIVIFSILFALSVFCLYLISYKYLKYGVTDMFDNIMPPNFIFFIVAAILGIAMVMYFSTMLVGDNYVAKIIAIIGECSLYIFALHMAIMTISREFLPSWGLIVEILLIIASITLGCILRPLFKKICPAVFK